MLPEPVEPRSEEVTGERARLRRLAWLALVCVGYIAAGKLGLSLAFQNPSATPVWPNTGIALASTLILGYRIWPAIFLGAFLVNVTTAGSAATCAGIAAGNTLEGVVGAYLLGRFAKGRQAFERLADVFKFAGLAAVASTTVSATIGVASLLLAGLAAGPGVGSIWLTWWLGDAVGALVVAPLLLLWSGAARAGTPSRARLAEGTLLALVLLLVGLVVFGGWFPGDTHDYPLEFLCLLPLLWAAFRFEPRGAATASAVLSAIAIAGTLGGFGPFVRGSANESLLLLQAFLGVATLTALALAAVVLERERFAKQLLYLVEHDALTGVLSRQRFETELARELAMTLRYGTRGALLFLDLDDFKRVNDKLGHRAGDELLARVTRLLKGRLRESDLLARLGGDEFVILVPHADAHQAEALARQLLAAIEQDGELAPVRALKISASLGIALFPEHGLSVDELLARADAAMYRAKEAGGNRVCLHAGDEAWASQLETRLKEGVRRRKR
jgi:diguanylate cyclase (GGDEF)-like protein